MTAYYKEITGLRAWAVGAVLLCHIASFSDPSWAINKILWRGWVGVDLFFVISGFLITEILLRNKASKNYFTVFYGRRALRIWPLYFLCMIAGYLLVIAIDGRVAEYTRNLLFYVLFIQNLFNEPPGIRFVDVSWSLMIEEQFYLVWPLLVYFFSSANILRLSFITLLALPVARFFALRHGMDPHDIYVNTFFHSDGLAAGTAFAIIRRDKFTHKKLEAFGRVAPFLLLPLLIGSFIWSTPADQGGNPLSFTVIALTALCLLVTSLSDNCPSLLRKALLSPVAQFIGEISYGIYLLQRFAEHTAAAICKPLAGSFWIHYVAFSVTFIFLSIAVAKLSWHFFEQPILRYKRLFNYKF